MEDYNSLPARVDGPPAPELSGTGAASPFSGRPVAPPTRTTQPLPAQPPIAGLAPPAAPYMYAPSPVQATGRQRAVKRGGVAPLLLALMLMLGLVAGGIGGGVTALTLRQSSSAPAVAASAPVTTAAQPVADQSANAIGTLYKKVAASVVQVQTTVGNGRFSGSGEGTGIVLDNSHILTNYHVVQGANTIRVVLQDGTSVDGTVAGTAPQDDLAVISATLPADKVQAATLGDSDTAQVGQEVVAIGNPFGLDHTVTAGIISAVNRSWSPGNQPLRPMLQTDAPINPGNSGGPLFDLQGEVLGINTAIQSPVEGSVGIGFAIPINRAKSLVPQLEGGSTVQRVWLGVSGIALDPGLAQQIKAPVSKGVLVAGVTSGSPAAQAGLVGADPATSSTLGDIITAIDSVTVTGVADISGYLDGKHAGDKVTLTIIRGGKSQQVAVTLAPWPAQQPQTGAPGAPTDPNTTP